MGIAELAGDVDLADEELILNNVDRGGFGGGGHASEDEDDYFYGGGDDHEKRATRAKNKHFKAKGVALYVKDRFEEPSSMEVSESNDHLGGSWFMGMADEAANDDVGVGKGHIRMSKMLGRKGKGAGGGHENEEEDEDHRRIIERETGLVAPGREGVLDVRHDDKVCMQLVS